MAGAYPSQPGDTGEPGERAGAAGGLHGDSYSDQLAVMSSRKQVANQDLLT